MTAEEEASVEDSGAADEVCSGTLEEATELEATSEEVLSLEEAAVEDASVEDASVEDASVEDASVEEASVEEASVEEASVEDEVLVDEAFVEEDALDEDEESSLYPEHEDSNALIASSELSFGQLLFKHDSTSSEFLEQIQDKSFNPLHRDFFSTCETHANKQAGGVANVPCIKLDKATKAEMFKTLFCIFQLS